MLIFAAGAVQLLGHVDDDIQVAHGQGATCANASELRRRQVAHDQAGDGKAAAGADAAASGGWRRGRTDDGAALDAGTDA